MPKKKSSITKILDDFRDQATNEEYWRRLQEIERCADMDLRENEALVVVVKNQNTGETKKYKGIRLKPMMKKIAS